MSSRRRIALALPGLPALAAATGSRRRIARGLPGLLALAAATSARRRVGLAWPGLLALAGTTSARRRIALALSGLLALAAAGCDEPAPPPKPPPPPVEARAGVDRAVATTGDVITYTVEVEHEAGIEVDVPEPGAEIAGLRVIDMGRDPLERRQGRVLERRWYQLRADLVGSYVLPPVRVSYVPPARDEQAAGGAGAANAAGAQAAGGPGEADAAGPDAGLAGGPTAGARGDAAKHAAGAGAALAGDGAASVPGSAAGEPVDIHAASDGADAAPSPAAARPAADGRVTLETSEIFLEVKSVLPPDGEPGDIRDIKPLAETRFGPPAWVLALAGAVVLLALAAGVWLWRRRRPAVIIPPAPPHEVAFAALDHLRRTDFSDPRAVERYYFDISAVLRGYVEGRFGLNATDLTTEEILPRLVQLPDLPPQQRATLGDFLLATDRVKFAAHQPSTAEIERVYEQALAFVETTAPAPEQEAQPVQPTTTEAAGVLR